MIDREIETKFQKHPYRTHSKIKWMEVVMDDLEEWHEALRNDINQLKEQMGQILERLESMQSHNRNALKQLQITLHHPSRSRLYHSENQTQYPPYGLPLGRRSSFHQNATTFEERLNALEGFEHSNFNVAYLCLFPDIMIPPKFELLAFEKYGGTACPKNHLTMYCRKMAPHIHDEELLIHFFQESLTRVALGWYLGFGAWTCPNLEELGRRLP
ncbi:hypothetical protein CR513_26570, partial [Mucuna pruriens]